MFCQPGSGHVQIVAVMFLLGHKSHNVFQLCFNDVVYFVNWLVLVTPIWRVLLEMVDFLICVFPLQKGKYFRLNQDGPVPTWFLDIENGLYGLYMESIEQNIPWCKHT